MITSAASAITAPFVFDADIAIFTFVTGPLSEALGKHPVQVEEEYDALSILAAVVSFPTIAGRVAYRPLPSYTRELVISLAEQHRL